MFQMSAHTYSKLLAKYHFEMALQPSLNKEVKMSVKRLPTIYFHCEKPFSSDVIFRCVFNASANLYKSLVFWPFKSEPCYHTGNLQTQTRKQTHANTHTHPSGAKQRLGKGWVRRTAAVYLNPRVSNQVSKSWRHQFWKGVGTTLVFLCCLNVKAKHTSCAESLRMWVWQLYSYKSPKTKQGRREKSTAREDSCRDNGFSPPLVG